MADTWSLVTPDGPYALNPTFSAPKYQPGGVSGPGALRRDERTTYQRSGDGLPTPGPLTLVGRVWRDDHNTSLMAAELNAIRAAVQACTSVVRTNNAGTYTYDYLAGGATPEITRDGLGGWIVKLDLWPGRAEPTFLPPGFTKEWAQYRQSSANGNWESVITNDLMTVRATTRPQGENPPNPQMLAWEGLRARKAGVAEFDARVRVRCVDHPAAATIRGVTLYARLPTSPPFTTPSDGLAHILHRRGATMRVYYGRYDPLNAPPAGGEHTFATSMIIGDWYWMRLSVTRVGGNEVLNGKMWRDDEPEPTWQVTRQEPIPSLNTPLLGGTIGVSNGGAGGAVGLFPLAEYEWDRAEDLSI